MSENRPVVRLQLNRRWLLWALPVLLALHVITPSRAWVALFMTFGSILLLAYVWARQMISQVHITRGQYYGWVHVGDLLEERFALQNNSVFPALWVEIEDQSDLPGYSASTVRSVDGRQTVRWRTDGICRQRGLFTLGPWQARMSDPFGLFDITFEYEISRSILVYPPVVHLPALVLPRGAATGTGRTSRKALEVTTNAAGIRAYAPGDSLNQVHWRSSARQDSLMVKTFDLEPSGDLWIVLDMDANVQAGEGEESTEEYGVILAASLADRTIRENRAVGLVAYGTAPGTEGQEPQPLPTLVMPQKGRAHQWSILQALAEVRAGGQWPLARVLAEMDRNLGRGTTLAVITASCNPDWVAQLLPPMRRGVAPTVLLLDPVSFGGAGHPEALTHLLANLGIPSHRITKGMPFEPVVQHQRIGRPEYKVLYGTGRVIPVTE